jgi:hypothetical protein
VFQAGETHVILLFGMYWGYELGEYCPSPGTRVN